MKSKKVRIGVWWMRTVVQCGELWLQGGHLKYKEYPEKQFFSFLASTPAHFKKLREFCQHILQVIDEVDAPE